jgi:hypothetical protein
MRAKRRWWRMSLVVMVLGFAPSLFYYFLNLWQREHYQFFPLAIAGAIYLARRDLAAVKETEARPWWGLAVGLVALGGYAMASWLWSPWLGYLSFLGAVLCGGGLKHLLVGFCARAALRQRGGHRDSLGSFVGGGGLQRH